MSQKKTFRSKCPVVESLNRPSVIFYVHYDGEFLGTVSAKTEPEARRKAVSKFSGLKRPDLIEVANSGKMA